MRKISRRNISWKEKRICFFYICNSSKWGISLSSETHRSATHPSQLLLVGLFWFPVGTLIACEMFALRVGPYCYGTMIDISNRGLIDILTGGQGNWPLQRAVCKCVPNGRSQWWLDAPLPFSVSASHDSIVWLAARALTLTRSLCRWQTTNCLSDLCIKTQRGYLRLLAIK